MNVETMYQMAVGGDEKAQQQLFEALSVRFHLFARHRIWNESDVGDIVQNALTVVFSKYKQVEIQKSFSAWAHGVLNMEILRYSRDNDTRRAARSRIRVAGFPKI